MENIVKVHNSQVVIGSYKEYLDNLLPSGRRIVVITDANIDRLYGDLVNGYEKVIIGQGEGNKTLATMDHIYRSLIELEVDRSTFLLGIGGGIVTDITGFVASTFMRGLDFGFIATTLLAQVDASVGGKNGVNFDGFKNMVGVFNQPSFVICDPMFLKSLPEREFASGLAEVIKCGVIESKELYDLFAGSDLQSMINDSDLLAKAIYMAIRIKADIVLQDERESNLRRKLNFGHTFAHAVEKSTHKYHHGEAVAIGMVMAARLSEVIGSLPQEQSIELENTISKFLLPTSCDIPIATLINALHSDKKRAGDGVNFVLTDAIGSSYIERLTFAQIKEKEDIF